MVITHGPAQGMMDYSWRRENAGDPQLLEAVARARPKLHCFGHIHEAWGAKLVTWQDTASDNGDRQHHTVANANKVQNAPESAAAINDSKSYTIESLSSLNLGMWRQIPEVAARRYQQLMSYKQERCCRAGVLPEEGSQTLFVNAAAKGGPSRGLTQRPWLVEISLPRLPRKAERSQG